MTTRPDPDGSPARSAMPRWVKALGIVAAVLAALALVSLVTGKGGHGPGRHLPPRSQQLAPQLAP